jgi:hypothetical protein
MELYFHSPNTPSWRGAQLKKEQGKFTFTLLAQNKVQHWRIFSVHNNKEPLEHLNYDQLIITGAVPRTQLTSYAYIYDVTH